MEPSESMEAAIKDAALTLIYEVGTGQRERIPEEQLTACMVAQTERELGRQLTVDESQIISARFDALKDPWKRQNLLKKS